jgi:hypothetical protein
VNWSDEGANTVSFSTTAQGPLFTPSYTYTGPGTYSISVTVTDANGDENPATFQTQVNSLSTASLHQLLTATSTLTIEVSTATTPANVLQMLNAVTGIGRPVTLILDLAGGTWSTDGIAYNPGDSRTAQNVTLIVQNGTLNSSNGPALTIGAGNVILPNDVIQESTGFTGEPPNLLPQGYVQQVVNAFQSLPVDPSGNPNAVFSLDTQNQADAFMGVCSSSNTNPLTAPLGATTPIDISVNLPSGIQLNEADLSIPPGFRVSINGGTCNGTPFTGTTTYTTAFGDTVTVTLGTAATSASPVGQYPITATLSGADAGNYVINPTTSTTGTMYVVSVGADPTSTTGAKAVTFWDNKGNARLITAADLSSLDALNLVTQGGSAFDRHSVAQLQAWLSISPNATAAYQLAVPLAAMDLNMLAGNVQATDLVFAGGLLPYATANEIVGLTSGGFIDVQELMQAANTALGQVKPGAPPGNPNQAYELALAQVLQAANGNTAFIQQHVLWSLWGVYQGLRTSP